MFNDSQKDGKMKKLQKKLRYNINAPRKFVLDRRAGSSRGLVVSLEFGFIRHYTRDALTKCVEILKALSD